MISPINALSKPNYKIQTSNNTIADNARPQITFENFYQPFVLSFTSSKTNANPGFSKTIEDYFIKPRNIIPDAFQEQAMEYIYEGKNTVVTAPTGTGKTLIAEYAIQKNLDNNKRTFYTVPIKALANDKYEEFVGKYGVDRVGIMTGDIKSANCKDAPIVVMTTEVYRNMLRPGAEEENQRNMSDLGSVVLDEFHYLDNEQRGVVWEESIVYSPLSTQLIALSATVKNADEISDWIDSINTEKQVGLVKVPKKNRHVPLKYFIFDVPAKKIEGIDSKLLLDGSGGYGEPMLTKVFDSLVPKLEKEKKLPAIAFIFNQKQCDNLSTYYARNGKCLLSNSEQQRLIQKVHEYQAENKIISESFNIQALKKGVASHHGGMLPGYKKLIEELYREPLIKIVFATDTLGVGINMPAKTTIITDLYKFNGEESDLMTINEFHQMAGRAGRRGIDKEGNVVVLANSPGDKTLIRDFVNSDPDKIESSFKLSNNFILNYIKANPRIEKLDEFFKKSLLVYQAQDPQVESETLQNEFRQKLDFLVDEGYVNKSENGYTLTRKGELAALVHIGNPFLVVDLLDSDVFQGLNKRQLASVASIVNISNDISNVIQPQSDFNEARLERINVMLDSAQEQIIEILNKSNNVDFKYSIENNDDFKAYLKQELDKYSEPEIQELILESNKLSIELQKEPDSEEDFSQKLEVFSTFNESKAKRLKLALVKNTVESLKKQKFSAPYADLLFSISIVNESLDNIKPSHKEKLGSLQTKNDALRAKLHKIQVEKQLWDMKNIKMLKSRAIAELQNVVHNNTRQPIEEAALKELRKLEGSKNRTDIKKQAQIEYNLSLLNLTDELIERRNKNKSEILSIASKISTINSTIESNKRSIANIYSLVANKKFLESQQKEYINLYKQNHYKKLKKAEYDKKTSVFANLKQLEEKAVSVSFLLEQKNKREESDSIRKEKYLALENINSKVFQIRETAEGLNKTMMQILDKKSEITLNEAMSHVVFSLLSEKEMFNDNSWDEVTNLYRKYEPGSSENEIYNNLCNSMQILKQFREITGHMVSMESAGEAQKYIKLHNKFDLAANNLKNIILQISSPIKTQ